MMIESLQTDMLVGGRLPNGGAVDVVNPFTGESIGEVLLSSDRDIDQALAHAARGAEAMRGLPAHERAGILEKAALLCDENVEDFAQLVVAEQGKTIQEARNEAGRLGDLLRYCAGEARRMAGEVLPLDASPGGSGRLGITLRQPAGVVVAITPFNYPMLLVAHKVGPAIAAGNAVIVKPSSYTPFAAFALIQLLIEAGLPEGAIQGVAGSGSVVGAQLCADQRVRVITFTGSASAGESITKVAGVKRLILELGANCPVVVLSDANVPLAASITAKGATANAGQVCISAQRVLVEQKTYGAFVEALVQEFSSIAVGNPFDAMVQMGPLISEDEASRVGGVIAAAVSKGAKLLAGGNHSGSLYEPTVVSDVPLESALFQDELFGPAVALRAVENLEEAINLCNSTPYGLGAGVFTDDIHHALKFAHEVDAGNVHVNWSPLWRADPMPYGGLKASGLGKEGPRYAIEEMSESKTVVVHPK